MRFHRYEKEKRANDCDDILQGVRGLSKTLLKQKSHTVLGDDVVVDFQAAMAMAI